MSNLRLYAVSIDGDAILSIQRGELREVAELRWDGATELIEGDLPGERQ